MPKVDIKKDELDLLLDISSGDTSDAAEELLKQYREVTNRTVRKLASSKYPDDNSISVPIIRKFFK